MVTKDPTQAEPERGKTQPLILSLGHICKLREVTALPESASALAPTSPALAEKLTLTDTPGIQSCASIKRS